MSESSVGSMAPVTERLKSVNLLMLNQQHLAASDHSISAIGQRENRHGLHTNKAPATIDF